MTKRLQSAAALIVVGLILQLATLVWHTPLSFLIFIFGGSPLVLAGMLFYLVSLVIASPKN
jgi:hypothetical protein